MPFSVLFYCKISFVAWWAMGNQTTIKTNYQEYGVSDLKKKKNLLQFLSAVINSLLVG